MRKPEVCHQAKWSLAAMHGGRIWFDSAPGQGTTFHFALPLKVRPSREMRAVSRV